MKSGRPATPNLLQNLARASRNRSAALAIATVLLASGPFAARANTLSDNITVTGGTVVEDGENVIITYTLPQITAAGAGRLQFKAGQASADVLAIGGGGSGGRTINQFAGAGAGGGAGGFVEVFGLSFKGTYDISIGAGAAGITTKPSLAKQGADGGNTTITQNGVQVAGIPVAKGGGGGGAGGTDTSVTGTGRNGGSGGGGSARRKGTSTTGEVLSHDGGTATSGQGFNGGTGNVRYVAAGGGGAGGVGATPESSDDIPYGGVGKQSQITGQWYAAGGAGGDTRAANKGIGVVAGSQGGGGSGGDSTNTGTGVRDAVANTGSGGGGGNTTQASGAGADGLVVIRLSNYIAGGVMPPEVTAFTYDGTEKVAAADTAYYKVSGDVKKTAAGNYTLTVTLTAAGREVGWDESTGITGDSTTVAWSIAKKKIDKPTKVQTANYTYDGSERTGYSANSAYTYNDQNVQTAAGTYTVTATLNDPDNTQWADKTGASRSDLIWTILQKSIAKPTLTATSFTYTGEEQTGYKESGDYTYNDQNKRTNAGTYTVTATLVDATNTKWADGAANPRSDLSWTIGPKEIAKPSGVDGLVYTGEEQTGVAEPTESPAPYTLTGHKQTNAGDHTATATLSNPAGVTNYKWKNGNADPLSVSWSIATLKITWNPGAAAYTYEKGTVRKPIPANDWYETVAGDDHAEDVGEYSCTVSLKDNTATQTNVEWTDGGHADKTFDWEITPLEVTVPSVDTTFTYAEEPKGTAVARTALTIPAGANYHQDGGDALTQSRAGEYSFTLALNDEQNMIWKGGNSDSKDFDWEIKSAENAIQGLAIADWQVGDTTPRTPSCTDVKFGSKTLVTYAWSTATTGPWTNWKKAADAPTAAGTYWLKASVPADPNGNWTAAEETKRFCVWTNPAEVFTDFIDIDLSERPANVTNVQITLREPVRDADGVITGGLPGFEYARAGERAREIRFVLTNAVKQADKLLPFKVSTWRKAQGESELVVQVPPLTNVKTIRMYWHAKDGDPKSDNHEEDVGPGTPYTGAPFATLVNREGVWVDYWTAKPSITKAVWQLDETLPTAADVNPGTLKNGSVEWFVLTMPRETTNEVETIQTAPGTYEIVFRRKDSAAGERYTLFDGEKRAPYEIIWHNTFEDLGGTASGRILLGGNNDTMAGHEITGQAYWQTDPSKSATYWVHDTTAVVAAHPYFGKGVNHTLYLTTPNGPQALWRLYSMRIGSFYPNSQTPGAQRNYLPSSSTAQAWSSDAPVTERKTYSVLAFRNDLDAVLYSSCYSNGIGVIYFDLVNGYTSDRSAEISVEYATQTFRGGEHSLPTDANCAFGDDPFWYLTHTDETSESEQLESEDCWLPVTNLTVLVKRRGDTEFSVDDEQEKLAEGLILPRMNTAGTTANPNTNVFYRIMAEINYAKHCRFRLRRRGSVSGAIDALNLVLLDNIIVSPPAMSASLDAPGTSDAESGRTGKQTLGQAGALSKAFPAVSDTDVKGRARVHYTLTPGIECDPASFIASARFNYRWRYLNQTIGPWQTVYLDHTEMTGTEGELIPTARSLDFKGRAGDIEWFYDMTLHAPAYDYVDYSGCGIADATAGFCEEVRAVTNRLNGTGLASGGEDWFVRLREGRSDWGLMKVTIASDDKDAKRMVGEYDMELVGDNMWRGMVVVPTNVTGLCRFSFRGFDLHENGDPDAVTEETSVFGVQEVPPGGGVAEIPNSGRLVDGGTKAMPFAIDHAAGYLEFRASDKFLTYQVGRAEYQDFNSWNDAHTFDGKFRADSVDTNCVDVADMDEQIAPIASWKTFSPTNSDWSETFYQTDYAPTPGNTFDKDIFRTSYNTPNENGAWSAQSITFVSERLVNGASMEQKQRSGMAGKLLGSGNGKIDFIGTSKAPAPQGLEKVELRARIGQSYTFDSITYCKSSFADDNYMFFSPVTMSHRSQNDDTQIEGADMAVGASASLVGYYSADAGCYEFRAERRYSSLADSTAPTVRLSIYKWYVSGFRWESKCLCYRDFDNKALWSYEKNSSTGAWNAEGSRKFYGMFISLETEYKNDDPLNPKSTRIVCGLSDAQTVDHTTSWKNFANQSSKTADWCGLVYTDKSDPYGWGSYGVTAKDCPAQFVMPAHVESPFEGTIDEKKNEAPSKEGGEGGEDGTYFQSKKSSTKTEDQPPQLLGEGQSFIDDRDGLQNPRVWATIPGRCESFVNLATGWTTWKGLRTPTNLVQNLDLYLKQPGTGESQWQKVGTQEVVGYGLKKLPAYDLKRTGQWDLRLQTSEDRAIDVVVDDIIQSRWSAPDINDPATIVSYDRSEIYVYSQSMVRTNATKKIQTITFQPARANAEHPVSIRSPVMGGLGKFTFSYTAADPHAEVWLQVATNRVDEGTLDGSTGYNDSLVSKELGEQQNIGEWLTVKRYSAGAADPELRLETGAKEYSKTVYLGWHNHADKPLHGVYRLFVPPAVVTRANEEAAGPTKNVDWGSITFTALSCTDEPGISDRSWRGWNMRTIGDSTDSERRMNLVDGRIDEEGGVGLVAALNNSWQNVFDKKGKAVDGTDLKVRDSKPAIYSPTMKPLRPDRGVGSVAVKARLYATDDVPQPPNDVARIVVYGARDSRASVWDVLCTNVVTSTVFTNFTWSADGNRVYTAVKFEVTEAAMAKQSPTVGRVILDEIVIGEKVPPTIGFSYARPFRMNLFSTEPVADIESPVEQPLAGESWGVQTKLTLQQLTDEIDVEKGFEVLLSYYKGDSPWGYEQWKKLPGATDGIRLLQAGDASNLVFRSYGETPESLVSPGESGETVQFMLTVKYYDRGGKSDTVRLEQWSEPWWFYPLAKNAENGGDVDPKKFSAYTVLDTVSPGRAWINEVNWNDGSMAENGGEECVTNQFVEICVPAGVDLTGWKLRVTDNEMNRAIFARLGDANNKIPARKDPTPNCTNGYEFLVLKSPSSTLSQADATWYPANLGTMIEGGTLQFNQPLQFELVRPSGVIEHQFVMDGTNTFAQWGITDFDGTNMIKALNREDAITPPLFQVSPKRFWALHDLSRTTDRAGRRVFSSTGVVGGRNDADTSYWPGGSNTWAEGMTFTPGRLNVGQTIPENWFILSNGTNAWVYFTVADPRISQNVDGDTNTTVRVVVTEGKSTNVTYTVANWREAVIRESNRETASVGGRGTFTYTVTPTGMVTVTATTQPQSELRDRFGLTEDNPYTPSVLRWLNEEYPDANAEDIRLARFKGLHAFDGESWMSLTDMYWLDIPPVPETDEEKATNDGTNWWFRGGISNFGGEQHVITRIEGGREVTYTNRQIVATMYMTNAVTHEAHAPQMLRGLDYTRSDDYTGMWTSVTFKVSGKLDLSAATDFLPFRTFIFDSGSFTGAGAERPFSSTIDILDPFQSPIGRNYGWDRHPNSNANFRWRINTDFYPYSIEMLKADSTYKGKGE